MKLRVPLLLAILSGLACAAPTDRTGTATSAIVGGTESSPDNDATVLVMHYDALAKGGGAASGCTGTLLAPRLVLTARHCVAKTDEGAACDRSGKPISGGGVDHDFEAKRIFVFGGRERPDFLAGTAKPIRGVELMTTGATTICNADIALVILEADVPDTPIAPVRLDRAMMKPNELVTVVGWGISETTNNPQKRLERTGVKLLEVGPEEGLGPAEFRTNEGTCAGDSGGPAFAGTGAVIGALSRGGNGKKGTGAEVCVDGATNIWTSTAGHAELLRAGYAKVGQDPWLEGEPSPLLANQTPVAAPPADDEGCSVGRGAHAHPRSRSGTSALVFSLAVLFAYLRRRNTAKSCI